eukprot:570712-Prymnesium_polylepis.2
MLRLGRGPRPTAGLVAGICADESTPPQPMCSKYVLCSHTVRTVAASSSARAGVRQSCTHFGIKVAWGSGIKVWAQTYSTRPTRQELAVHASPRPEGAGR